MSEFGQGYAVCLRQFLWHEPRLGEYVKDYAKARKLDPRLFDEGHAIEIWIDGAVDHLYDLRRPRRFVTTAQWQDAKRLQQAMMGGKWGGRYGHGPALSEADVRMWLGVAESLLRSYAERGGVGFPETFHAAWELDESAGLRPQRGDSATCEEPIALRRVRVAAGR